MSLDFSDDLDFNVLSALEIRDAVRAGGEHVGKVAQEHAPLLVDLPRASKERRSNPGALKESLAVRPVDEKTVEIAFTEFYAKFQHERLDYHHESGEAKFLERAMVSERDEALRVMAAKLREGLHS